MRSGLLAVVLAVAGLAAACSDGTRPDSGTDFHVSPARTWAGSDVLVQQHLFTDLEQDPVFQLTDSVLDARKVNDSTWTVTLPVWATGQAMLKLALASGHTFTLDPIWVRGFAGTQEFSTTIFETLMVRPEARDAVVLGGDGMNLLEINATRNTQVRLDSLLDWSAANLRGPGPTEQSDEFLVWPHDSTMQRWTLDPAPEQVSATTVTYARAAMQFGQAGLFIATNHEFSVTGPGLSYSEGAEEVQGGVISPAHDRATIRVNWDQAGVPVFDVATGAIAYRVPGMQSSEGAAFSADGQWLAVAGGKSCVGCTDSARVVVLRASDGTLVHDTTVAGAAWGVAFDRSRPLLYVGILRVGTTYVDSLEGPEIHPGVLVLDRDNFTRLGMLAPPLTEPACWSSRGQGGCYGAVLATSDEPAVYAITGFNLRSVYSWRFDTQE